MSTRWNTEKLIAAVVITILLTVAFAAVVASCAPPATVGQTIPVVVVTVEPEQIDVSDYEVRMISDDRDRGIACYGAFLGSTLINMSCATY